MAKNTLPAHVSGKAIGPSLVEIMIDPVATPIHGFQRRLADPNPKAPVRPGTVYELRPWKLASDLPDPATN